MTWKGKTYKMGKFNKYEQRLIDTLLKTKHIDITKPFEAKEALQAIRLQREEDGEYLGNMPNKFRLNYIFKKCPSFTSSKNSRNMNLWVYNGGEEE